jgi:two-component system nitrate/nitrite response regulator NarL
MTTVLISLQGGLMREGIGHLLRDRGYSIVEDIDSDPDIVVVDASLGPAIASSEIKFLTERIPRAKLLLLNGQAPWRPADVFAAFRFGNVFAYLSMPGIEVFVRTLELAQSGTTVMPRDAVLSASAPIADTPAEFPEAMPSLSQREIQIIDLLCQGKGNKSIANFIGIAEATVKVHVKSVLRKLRLNNRTQAALWGAKHLGLLRLNGSKAQNLLPPAQLIVPLLD